MFLVGLFLALTAYQTNAQAVKRPVSQVQQLLAAAEEDRLTMQYVPAYLTYEKAMTLLSPSDSVQWIAVKHGLASCLIRLNAPEAAQELLSATQKVIQRRFGEKSPQMLEWYDLMGELYYKRLVADPALAYWKKANQLALELYGPAHMQTARTYRQLGRFFIGEAGLAVSYALKAVQILRHQPQHLQHKEALVYYNILGYAIHEEAYQKAGYTLEGKHHASNLHAALAYYDSALLAEKSRRGNQKASTAMVYHNIGNSYNNLYGFRNDLAPALQKGADSYFASANANYDKAIALFEKNKVHPGSATLTLVTKAILLQLKDDWHNSLELYTQGMRRLMPREHIKDALQVPIVPRGIPQREYLLLLTGKIKSLLKLYEANKNPAYLNSYHQHVVQYISFLEEAKREATSLAGSTANIDYEGASEGYGWGINSSYLLYETTGQERYLQQALDITNRFKSYSLLHNEVKYQNGPVEGGKSASEIASQQLEERWKELEEKKALLDLYPELGQASTFKGVEVQWQNTKAQLEVQRGKGPSMLTIPKGQNIPTLQQLQKELSGEEALLELVHFDRGITPQRNKLFAFVITKEKVTFLKLADMDSTLLTTIPALHQALALRQNEPYRQSAYQVYAKVAAPILRHLPGQIKKLIVLPDSEYWRIPFGALLTKPVGHFNFREYPYLLQQYDISYGHSSAYWYVLRKGRAFSKLPQRPSILALAPYALSGKGASFLQLPFTASLLDFLQQRTPGTYLVDSRATEAFFKQHAHKYSILHLATHAEANAEDPALSKFQLAKGGGEDGALYLEELLQLNLRPALAILSACETELGVSAHRNRAKVHSLSWSFKFIGAQSTVATLWKVDDRSTAALLKGFYEGILSGEDKSIALSDAKRRYITQVRTAEEAHPFYWAGLVLNGQEQAFETSFELGKWLKLALAAYLLLLLLFGARQVFLQRTRR
ncbi:CHAT domain-containing protein [Nibribacter ruber]|uniref:CHAT domain-containing protein n=1 Tax=Nibribacter ruber TaxID=2698458 RepID=A0A6P1P1J6_9BACT|nr:CHAT domain-containing tetratricopeptide repeat protein [Nibribacter ruber]QHL87763.1 CHAT domain-containing protein [Nibribacter ruber]